MRCLIKLDITDEERWHPTSLIRRWLIISGKEVEGLRSALERTSMEPWEHAPMTP